MLIGIDGNEANVTERVGVNVWAYELLKQLEARSSKREARSSEANLNIRVYLACPPLDDLPKETEHWQYRVLGDVPFWTRWRLPLDLYIHGFKGSDLSGRSDPFRRPDVFLSLSHYAPRWAPMPRIVSIMDLSFLTYPDAFKPWVRWQLERWTKESIMHAAHVVTISEFTKKEIHRIYDYPFDQITVVYPGVSQHIQALRVQSPESRDKVIQKTKKNYGIGRYLLFVGTLQPKKNLPRLIEAFTMIQKDFPNVQLVIAGKRWKQFTHEKFAKLLEVSRTSSVRVIGYVADADLPALIAGAECLVLPSLYEGFGIPALEAMALGTPVVASNTTSIPEVLGDPSIDSRQVAGVLFDPTNVSDIARGMRDVLSWSVAKRQEQINKGMIRAEKFSWEESAKNALRAVRSLE